MTPEEQPGDEKMSETKSLGETFPKEQARIREVLEHFKAIGPDGMFGVAMIEAALQRADQAAMSGDLVAMLRSFQELKEIES